jgi:hypothetical protein
MNSSIKIEKHAKGSSLLIDGIPRALFGGQVHNSSTSSIESIKATFSKAKKLNYNFVIGSLNWDQFERTASELGLKLVVLWFGAFKNAASTYAPTWVRSDSKRFPRAVVSKADGSVSWGHGPVLSVFSPELLEADKRAFGHAMETIANLDQNQTVVMVQVENEVGLLGSSRDYCELAEEQWSGAVPEAILQAFTSGIGVDDHSRSAWVAAGSKPSGTWVDVVGDTWQGHEIFMAWYFAQYVNGVADSGKEHLDIPMYANAWLGPQEGQESAGQWPSGGPASTVLDIWKLGAPSLSFLSPDIYVQDARAQMDIYHRPDNPLFIPEARHVTGNMFWAIGHHSSIGYSMFGAEDGRVGNQMSQAYAHLAQADSVVAKAQAEGRIAAILLEGGQPLEVRFGTLRIKISDSFAGLSKFVEVAGVDLELHPFESTSELEELPSSIPSKSDARPFGLIIQESELEFLLIAKGVSLDFSSEGYAIEVDRVQEGRFVNQEWVPARELNGDERLAWVPMHEIGACKVRLLAYK